MSQNNLKIIHLIIIFILILDMANSQEFSEAELKNAVSTGDIYLEEPVSRREGGLPIGNGRMGTLVWTKPWGLRFQINRVDVYASDKTSNSFFQRNTDFGFGLGFIDINLSQTGKDIFIPGSMKQHLSIWDGKLDIKTKEMDISIFAWMHEDVIALKINDKRENPEPIEINLRMLRPKVLRNRSHISISSFVIKEKKAFLIQKFIENSYFCASCLGVGVSQREAKIRKENELETRIIVKPGEGIFYIYVSSCASFKKGKNLVKGSNEIINKAIKKDIKRLKMKIGIGGIVSGKNHL